MKLATAIFAAASLLAHALLGCCAHHEHPHVAGNTCAHEAAVAETAVEGHDHDDCHHDAPAHEQKPGDPASPCGESPCCYTLTKCSSSTAKALDSISLPPAPVNTLSLGQGPQLEVAACLLQPAASLHQLRQILLI